MRKLAEPFGGVVYPEWVEPIPLPYDLQGGSRWGLYEKIRIVKKVHPLMVERGFIPDKSRKGSYSKIRASGNQLFILYDSIPRERSVFCFLVYRGATWQHEFYLVFAKGYSLCEYGIESEEHLDQAIMNNMCILNHAEETLLAGLDEIYGKTPEGHIYPDWVS